HHEIIGGNFRLDELQAAVLLVKLRHLDAWTARRQENARWYSAALDRCGLGDRVATPRWSGASRHIFNQYVLRAQRRDALRDHLAGGGIGTEVYYPVPLHMQACFDDLGYRPDDLPEARRAAGEAVPLPTTPDLTPAQRPRAPAQTVALDRSTSASSA